jgi:hypothetical protein
LTTDEIVKLARKQVDCFNTSNWDEMRATLASDSRYDELGTGRKVGSREDPRAFQGLEDGVPGCRRHGDKRVRNRERAALEVTWKGTQTGPLVTPESCHYFDSMALFKQIDAAG